MKFSQLARYFEKIENTSSRLAITHILADLLKELQVSEIAKTIYLLQGRIAPQYESLEFGMAERMVGRGIISAFGIDGKTFSHYFKKIGDMGKTAEHFKKEKRSLEEKDLTVLEVF